MYVPVRELCELLRTGVVSLHEFLESVLGVSVLVVRMGVRPLHSVERLHISIS